MKNVLRRIRGAAGMGLIWAVGFGGVGALMEVLSNILPGFGFIDMWVPMLAIPGFLCGVGFAGVLRIAEGRRRFDELSFPRFAAWGAVGGLLAGGLTARLMFGADAFTAEWLPSAVVMGTTTILSTLSASTILALARKSEGRDRLDSSADLGEAGLTAEEKRALLGGKS